MKLKSIVVSLLALATLNCFGQTGNPSTDQAIINSIHLDGTNVVVVVHIPAGLKKVTLEGRKRISAGTWEPHLVQRLDGNGGELTFRLPRSGDLELLRVRADATEPLPASFYQGTNLFAGQATSTGTGGGGALPPATPGAGPVATVDNSKSSDTRSVVESDIWKIEGDTLYFFNQYRGLQVIDVSAPDKPVIRGTLSLPAAGEQMYLLENNFVVLLARDGCGYFGDGSESEALVVGVVNGAPVVAAHLPIQGYIQESRMVGTALYVASQSYRKTILPPKPGSDGSAGEIWEWGTVVSSFDLKDPANPAIKDTYWVAGYGNVIYATDKFLLVATQGSDGKNWWQSKVTLLDISSPDGAMKALAKITPQGRVPDKFKLNIAGDTLTIISEDWSQRVVTTLETFSLTDPTSPQPLGSLTLAKGEQLHATRFDGDRAYIVTFFRVDPLFIVDLSDPKTPRIAGQLEVPGWSTYIQPWGNRLVTMGIESSNSWRVAVSLYDVKDASKPTLLSRVPLGENYSWSEANYDEKAFGFLPENGLLLVPYSGNTTNGYATRVQLINLSADDLVARGAIEHKLQPRRATVHRNRVLSLSGRELFTVNATDRDHPAVTSDTELSWPADRVFAQGDYLLQLAYGNTWNQDNPTLRVARANQADQEVNRVVLGKYPILGATVSNGRLYLAQGDYNAPPIYIYDDKGNQKPNPDATVPNLYFSIYDLTHLPGVILLGQTNTLVDSLGYGNSWQAVWPTADQLVWSGGSYGYWWGWLDGGIVGPRAASGGIAKTSAAIFRPWWGGGGGRLFALDVNNAGAPKLKSEVNLGTNGWWSFSSAFATNGLVYLSHQASEFVEGVLPPGVPPPAPIIIYDKVDGQVVPVGTNQPPIGTWVQRYYLDVVDYADAANPLVRKPVNIPGMLRGLSHAGAVIYTVGAHWDPKTFATDWSEWLDASAYDGVAASLIDSDWLGQTWPHPVLVSDKNIFIGRAAVDDKGTNTLEIVTLADTGKISPVTPAPLQLSFAAQNLYAFGDLLVVQVGNGVQLFNKTTPAALTLIGAGGPQGCVYFNPENADGDVSRGLWLPLGDYGVAKVEVKLP
ncbi:MAG: beta-propeller domain-containing protein [Verrucomicrobia bacterium]|nr:beta-propeller domain-containing protein [Verrucomicrobiota bacterium]